MEFTNQSIYASTVTAPSSTSKAKLREVMHVVVYLHFLEVRFGEIADSPLVDLLIHLEGESATARNEEQSPQYRVRST